MTLLTDPKWRIRCCVDGDLTDAPVKLYRGVAALLEVELFPDSHCARVARWKDGNPHSCGRPILYYITTLNCPLCPTSRSSVAGRGAQGYTTRWLKIHRGAEPTHLITLHKRVPPMDYSRDNQPLLIKTLGMCFPLVGRAPEHSIYLVKREALSSSLAMYENPEEWRIN